MKIALIKELEGSVDEEVSAAAEFTTTATESTSNTSLTSDGPGDDVMIAPEIEESVISYESSDESYSETSSEDDCALSLDINEAPPNTQAAEMVEAISGEFDRIHVTRDDDTLYNTRSIHHMRNVDGKFGCTF